MDLLLGVAIVSVFLVSFVFSMFGQGGGSLYTPILFILGYATLVSVSASLVLNLITALFATIVYYRSRLVDLRLALAFHSRNCSGVVPRRCGRKLRQYYLAIVDFRRLPRRSREQDGVHALGEDASGRSWSEAAIATDLRNHSTLQSWGRSYLRTLGRRRRNPYRSLPDIRIQGSNEVVGRNCGVCRDLFIPVRRLGPFCFRAPRLLPNPSNPPSRSRRRNSGRQTHGADARKLGQSGIRTRNVGLRAPVDLEADTPIALQPELLGRELIAPVNTVESALNELVSEHPVDLHRLSRPIARVRVFYWGFEHR